MIILQLDRQFFMRVNCLSGEWRHGYRR